MSATNMAYFTQYYDSLWDYKNVDIRRNMQYSKDTALRDYYKWSAGNAKKDFDSYGLRNAVDYGTKIFQNIPRLKLSSHGNPSSSWYRDWETDRKSTRLNSSHSAKSRMPSSA